MTKKIYVLAVAAILTLNTSTAVIATTTQAAAPPSYVSQEVISQSIAPRADVIVNKYRDYDGKLQVRRWNETKGYWVDAEWRTISIH